MHVALLPLIEQFKQGRQYLLAERVEKDHNHAKDGRDINLMHASKKPFTVACKRFLSHYVGIDTIL